MGARRSSPAASCDAMRAAVLVVSPIAEYAARSRRTDFRRENMTAIHADLQRQRQVRVGDAAQRAQHHAFVVFVCERNPERQERTCRRRGRCRSQAA